MQIWLVAVVALIAVGAGAYLSMTGSHSATPRPAAENKAVEPSAEPSFVVSGPPWFRDMTAASGVDFTYRNDEEAEQYAILESLGGGAALFDYDGDGLLDLFVTGGGRFDGPNKRALKGLPCKLYRNLGGWKFQDVTQQVGLDLPWWYTHGAAVADYDRDGRPDLLVTGYGRLALFHNEPDGKGGVRFVDVSETVGLRDDSWSTSAGWGDLDGDGFPDLYVCHYVDWSFDNHPKCSGPAPDSKPDICPPQWFKPLAHALFHNDRGKAFRKVSAEHGFKAEGRGLGVLLADLNDDRRPDFYVANDMDDNLLFFNRGPDKAAASSHGKGSVAMPVFKLEERGRVAGVALSDSGSPDGSMGVDAADYDGSGRPSLFVSNFQNELHALYRNLGRENFLHHSRAAGLGALGYNFVGFGTGFLDVDNDGWEDLVMVNGHAMRRRTHGSTYRQRPLLLHNVEYQGRRFFKDISPQGGDFFQTPQLGRGLAVGDLDNDGRPDLVVNHTNSPVALLQNQTGAALPKPGHWLGVRLVGRDHRDVVGSTVRLAATSRTLTRFVKGGGSYLSANDPRILFGLAESEKVGRLTVQWSWGETQTWDGLEPNCYWELHEGQPRPRRLGK